MVEKPAEVLRAIRKRELDIKIMQLQLKHKLTKKRVECKLLIMYHKACNAALRAQLMMHRINGDDVKTLNLPNSPNRSDLWKHHRNKI